ncbi:MAG: hypothetical protein IJV55_01875 [Paludibacteraceae bacterium]|nr:hypothetical protein [Paludibacteraceae bacterium]
MTPTITPPEARAGIAEKVHNIMDILRDYPDEVIDYYCEHILNRLDTLAGANMEDYD